MRFVSKIALTLLVTAAGVGSVLAADLKVPAPVKPLKGAQVLLEKTVPDAYFHNLFYVDDDQMAPQGDVADYSGAQYYAIYRIAGGVTAEGVISAYSDMLSAEGYKEYKKGASFHDSELCEKLAVCPPVQQVTLKESKDRFFVKTGADGAKIQYGVVSRTYGDRTEYVNGDKLTTFEPGETMVMIAVNWPTPAEIKKPSF